MPVSSRLAAAAAFWMVPPLLAAAAPTPIGAAAIVTPDDLEVALVASEPMLVSPSNIDVDARGRVWVCEVTNYRGRRDTRPEGDRILVLEDTDGDGRTDTRKVFHQGRDVDSALGICVIGEGPGRRVIVSCSPDVLVFHDVDGDLVADRTERLFTKTGMAQHDHSLHAFSVGPDGRCYFNFGNYGRAVHDRDGKPVVDRFGVVVNDSGRPYRQGMVFRCRPDGSDFEVLGHNFRNPFEVAADSFGTLWQSDNDDDGFAGVRINYVMEYGNFGYRDERSGEGWQIARSNLEPEVPRRHWHQNDPGVVPNLLATGAGSPTGICVYEGTALPERFRGAVVHCDALPNVVRAYPVSATGAGYSATILPIADGSADRWFRPSDVCVAPDGSLIVADWHDPGVGGHGMGDVEKGRIYRIASRGAAWKVPAVDLATVEGAVAALASPNLCTRATALDRLARDPAAAGVALAAAFAAAGDVRLRARLAWAAGMLAPGAADAWVERLAGCAEPELRTVGLRLCRAVHGPGAAGGRADPRAVTALAARFAADDSAAVRREAALALKGIAGADADRAWAALAKRHEAGDRWQLEALGIGADGLPGTNLWDGRLEAWRREAAAAWRQPAGREVVWRSRAAATPALLAELITDPSVSAAEGLAMVRSLDFQDAVAVRPAVMAAVRSLSGPEDKIRAILPELVVRLHRDDTRDTAIAARVEEAAGLVPGTPRLVEIVRKFGLSGRTGELVALAAAEGTPDALASSSAAAAFELGGADAMQQALAANDAAARRLTRALGLGGKPEALALLAAVVAGTASPAEKAAAIGALARSERGARRVIEIAKASGLDAQLTQAAALAIATSPWADVKKAAEGVLPIPAVQRGAKLPPVEELLRQAGVPDRGREVFATVGTCSKCHVVNGDGKAVGPNLSAVGTKLSREALFESILKPSAAISHNYDTHTAVLADGRSVTGLIISKSDKQVVIRGVDGVDVTVPADDMEEMVRQPLSLMPADLAASLSAQQLVDLVAWLETLKAPQ